MIPPPLSGAGTNTNRSDAGAHQGNIHWAWMEHGQPSLYYGQWMQSIETPTRHLPNLFKWKLSGQLGATATIPSTRL